MWTVSGVMKKEFIRYHLDDAHYFQVGDLCCMAGCVNCGVMEVFRETAHEMQCTWICFDHAKNLWDKDYVDFNRAVKSGDVLWNTRILSIHPSIERIRFVAPSKDGRPMAISV